MKKSFMTRALAMGLSFAMAFSLSAATNVTTASAAAKKASVTTFMKASSKTVTEGKSVTAYMKSDVAKKYRIKSHTESDVAKKYISVKMLSSRKGVTITAEDGAVTAANLEKKGVNTKIYFAPAKSASAVKKAKATKYVNLKVAVKAAKQEEKPEEVVKAISSATQTGVKTITVTTNFDATNSTVKVTRGSNAVETDKVSFSEDGKTITILTTANVVAAEYTVTVDDLTKNFTGETSKVDKIEILSELAAVEKDSSDKYKQATVGYKVSNQFGDDITKTTTLTVNSSATRTQLDAKNHLIRFYSDTEYMIGRDLITVVLLDSNNTGVSAQATLTVSMEAYAKELTYEGLYNADKKTLTEDTKLWEDTFYALFSAVDQYGNQYKSYKNVKADKDLFITVMGGLTSLTKGSGAYFTVIEKDGTPYLAYPLEWTGGTMEPVAGEATVQLLSSGGASCTGTITVAEGERVASITVNDPPVLAAGAKTEIPFTATDASGKEVTSFKILKKVEINNGSASNLKWVKNTDGTGKLVLDATYGDLKRVQANSPKIMTYTFTTQSKKFYNKQLTITENARPVAIDGVQGVSTTVSSTKNEFEIKLSNLKIEDQYGNVMNGDALDAAAKDSAQYTFGWIQTTVLYDKNNTGAIKLTTYTGKDSADQACNSVTSFAAKGKDTVIAKLKPDHKGEVTIEFAFANACGINSKDYVKDSANVMFTVKDTANVEEATATVGTIYAVDDSSNPASKASTAHQKAYAQEVKVVAGGAQLSASDYTVSLPDGLAEDPDNTVKDNVRKIYYDGAQNDIKEFKDGTATTVTKTIKITLNGTGETFTQDVTISKVAPYVNSVSLKAGKDTYVVPATATALKNENVLDYCIDNVKDQYGVKLILGDFTAVTFANGTRVPVIYTFQYKTDTAGVLNNGSTSAQLTPNSDFDAATMLVAFGKNVDEKAVAEINLVGGTKESNPALYKFAEALRGGNSKEIVKAIDNSAQLNGGTDWGKLTNIDKIAVVTSSAFKTSANAASGSATSLNAVVKTAAVSAAAVRKQINENEVIKDLIASKATVLTNSSLQVSSTSAVTVTGSAITGSAILGGVTNAVTIANLTDTIVTGSEAKIFITYNPSTAGLSENIVDVYTIKVVKDPITGVRSYKVTYVDATL